MPPAERIRQLLDAYADGPKRLEAAVAGLSEHELDFTPGAEHWSARINIIHLVDADLIGAARLRYVLAQPGVALVSFDQNVWATALHYESQPVAPALALFGAVRASTVEVLRRAPADAWGYAGVNTQSGPETVEFIVNRFVEHFEGHLKTIAKRRQQHAEAVGGRR